MTFTTTWKGSTQVRKQRKYRYNAPLHVKQKFMHVHLSAELRKKHGLRNIQIRSGDKVRVMRGKFSKKEGKVDRVSIKQEKVYVTGLEVVKKEGAKLLAPLAPSNLMIIELDLANRKRKAKVTVGKTEEKVEKKAEVKIERKVEAKEEKVETKSGEKQ